MKKKLAKQKKEARIQRKKAEKEIAATEIKIAASRKKTQGYQKELIKIEAGQEKIRIKNEKTQAELELVRDEETKVAREKRDEQRTLDKIKREHNDMKRDAKRTATRVSAMRKQVKGARVAIGKVYRNMKKDSNEYKKMIRIYRRTLSKANRMLDELELSIEVDKAYDQKLADSGRKLPKGFRTVSGLNKTRYANVKSSKCHVRPFPSAKATVIDTFPVGKKVQMKYHSRSWYTVVHGGEKAFLGKGCFN